MLYLRSADALKVTLTKNGLNVEYDLRVCKDMEV